MLVADLPRTRVRALRHAHHETLEMLGAAVGIKKNMLSRKEREKSQWYPAELCRIAQRYNTTIDYLFLPIEEEGT